MAPAERVACGVRRGVGEDGQHEAFRVPERVAVVTGPCQALGGDCAVLGAGSRLERVEEREAHGLLKLEVTLELDVGSIPEIVEVGALGRKEAVPAGVPRLRERRDAPGRGLPGRCACSTSRTPGT